MKERLIELMELLNLNPTQFANAIGVQRTTLQHILSGRNEPSLKIIMAVHSSFPNVELEWLLSGKGSAVEGLPDKTPAPAPDQDYPLLPGMESAFFPVDAQKAPVFSNHKDESQPVRPVRKRDIKEVTPQSEPSAQPETVEQRKPRSIKEVVIFFEDGTYQKFSSELKK